MVYFFDKLLYFDPEDIFCNVSAIKITTAYHQGNQNMQVCKCWREIHKTQVVTDHVNITSRKSVVVDDALSSSFTLISCYARHSTGTSAELVSHLPRNFQQSLFVNTDIPLSRPWSQNPITCEVSVSHDIDSPSCGSHGRNKGDVL